MRLAMLYLLLAGCVSHAEASESNCGPATPTYQQSSGAGCAISDGGVFRLADGRAAPHLFVCTEDGSVVESWCQP